LRWILKRRGNVDACNDVRLTETGNAKKRAATHDAYRVTSEQRIAARRALEWIGMSKAWLDFRYEISDLLYSMGQKVG